MEYIKSMSGTIESNENSIVRGYYGSDTVDVDGHFIDANDFIEAFREYLAWGNIRNNHGEAVGSVINSFVPEKPWNYFEVEISDPTVAILVNNGVYKGFSVGMKIDETAIIKIPLKDIPLEKYNHLPKAVIRKIKKAGFVSQLKSFYIYEISITDHPKNIDAKILKSHINDGVKFLPPSYAEEIMYEQIENSVTATEEATVSNDTVPEIDVTKSETTITIEIDTTPSSSDTSVMCNTPMDVVEAIPNTVENNVITATDIVNTVVDVGATISSDVTNATITLEVLFGIVNELSAKIDNLIQLITGFSAVYNAENIVTKSEIVTEEPTKDVNDELFNKIADLFKKELNDNASTFRKGHVNSGNSTIVEQPLDVSKMDKREAYSAIANMIAKRIKG